MQSVHRILYCSRTSQAIIFNILVLAFKLVLASTAAGEGSLTLVASTDQPMPECFRLVDGDQPHIHVAQVNSTVQLNCTFNQTGQAYQARTIQWLRDGKELEVTVLTGELSELILEQVQVNDSGVYSCRLLDNGTVPAATMELRVGTRPPKATNFHCASNDFSRVFCRWTEGPSTSPETTYSLLFALRNKSGDKCPRGNAELKECNATSGCRVASAHKRYIFFVKSSNALWFTYISTDFIPYGDTVTRPPRLVRVIALSRTSLQVFVKPPIGYEDFPLRIKPHSYYKFNVECLWPEIDLKHEEEFDADHVSNHSSPIFNLTNLKYCAYRITARVRFRLDESWSNSSNVIEARPLEGDPDAKINLDIKCPPKVTDESANISWTPVTELEMKGIVSEYVVTVEDFSGITAQRNITVLPNVTWYEVTGLDPTVHYKIHVVALNSVSGTDWNAHTCEILPSSRGITDRHIVVVIVPAVLLPVVVIFLLLLCLKLLKKSKFSGIRLHNHFHNRDINFSDTSRHPQREREQFDELASIDNVGVFNRESKINASCDGNEMTNGFVLERDQSLQPILDSRHPLLDARRICVPANENCTKEPMEQTGDSGGSYLTLRSRDDTSHPSSMSNTASSYIQQDIRSDNTLEHGPDGQSVASQGDFSYTQMGVAGKIVAPETIPLQPQSWDEKLCNPSKTNVEPGQYVTQGFFPWATHDLPRTSSPNDHTGSLENADGDESNLLLSCTEAEGDSDGANLGIEQIPELANMLTADDDSDASRPSTQSPKEAAEQNTTAAPEGTVSNKNGWMAVASGHSGYISMDHPGPMKNQDSERTASGKNEDGKDHM